MNRLILRYILVLTTIVTCGWLYSLAAVPLIEGDVSKANQVKFEPNLTDRMERDDRFELASLLPADSWEFGNCIRLDTQQGQLLFKEYRQLEDGRLEVEPLTAILETDSDDPSRSPLMLQSDQGAVLRFSEPFSLGKSNVGRMEYAWLKGDVRIVRHSSEDKDDHVEILTNNVSIDQQLISAPSEVAFQFGQHRGSGRNLTLQLLPSRDPQARRNSLAPFGDLGVLELVTLHELSLHPEPDMLESIPTANDSNDAEGHDSSNPAEPLPVVIRCSGPFQFDFQAMEAEFQTRVIVTRMASGSAEPDQLTCDQLKATFGSKPITEENGLPTDPQPVESTSSLDRMKHLELHSLEAYGSPAMFRIPSQNAYAEAATLSFEPKTGLLFMRDEQRGMLRHESHQITSPQISYQLSEDGRLGNGSAQGPGRIIRYPTIEEPRLEITWTDELLIRPHEGLKAISLYGSPHLEMGESDSFDAAEVHLWIDEIPVHDPNEMSNDPDNRKWKFTPVKLLAVGDHDAELEGTRNDSVSGRVNFDSPNMSADTLRLEVFFGSSESFGVPSDRNDDGSQLASQEFSNSSANSSPLAPSLLSNPSENQSEQETNPQKLACRGDLARIRLTPVGKDYRIDELTLGGNVEIRETILENPEDEPLVLFGNVLQANARGADFYHLVLQGEPNRDASFSARGISLFGNQINLDQLTNQVWIDGPGRSELSRPSAALVVINQRQPELAAARNQFARPTLVDWRQGMQFDGRTIVVQGEVHSSGTEWTEGGERYDWRADSDVMSLVLDRQVQLTDTDTDRESGDPQAKVQTLILEDNVRIHTESYDENGYLTSLDELAVPNLQIDQTTGDIRSVGAGSLSSVRYGKMNLLTGEESSSQNVSAESPSRPEDEPELIFIDVEFSAGIVGNIERKEVHFVKDIDALFGPVADWTQRLDRGGTLHQPGRDQARLLCDRLVATQWGETPEGRPAFEVQGLGNAFIAGNGYEAIGAKIAFNQLSNLLILEGDQHAYAKLLRRVQGIGTGDYAEAAKIMYWRDQNRIEVDGGHAFSGTYQGRLAPPRQVNQP